MTTKKIRKLRHAEMKAWLESKEITAEEFATKTGEHFTTAQSWIFRGVIPKRDNRRKLAQVFPDCPALRWKI